MTPPNKRQRAARKKSRDEVTGQFAEDAAIARVLFDRRSLAKDERAILRRLNRGSGDETMGNMRKEDLRTLNPDQWLVDVVMDAYAALVVKRAPQPSTFAFPVHFYPMLSFRGFKAVQDYTDGVDVFALRAVFFPILDKGNHWTLIVADMVNRALTYYDSSGGTGKPHLRRIAAYLAKEFKARHRERKPWNWELKSPGFSTPQQTTGHDCGVFVLAQLSALHERDVDRAFSQADVPRFRRQIQLELATT